MIRYCSDNKSQCYSVLCSSIRACIEFQFASPPAPIAAATRGGAAVAQAGNVAVPAAARDHFVSNAAGFDPLGLQASGMGKRRSSDEQVIPSSEFAVDGGSAATATATFDNHGTEGGGVSAILGADEPSPVRAQRRVFAFPAAGSSSLGGPPIGSADAVETAGGAGGGGAGGVGHFLRDIWLADGGGPRALGVAEQDDADILVGVRGLHSRRGTPRAPRRSDAARREELARGGRGSDADVAEDKGVRGEGGSGAARGNAHSVRLPLPPPSSSATTPSAHDSYEPSFEQELRNNGGPVFAAMNVSLGAAGVGRHSGSSRDASTRTAALFGAKRGAARVVEVGGAGEGDGNGALVDEDDLLMRMP